MEFIYSLFKYSFLQNALIIGIIIGTVAGLVGSFSILQGTSLIGDAMSHAVLPGIAIAFLLGIPLYIGAGIFGILAASIIALITEYSPLKSDTVIGLTFSSFFALGTIIISQGHANAKLNDILFGNILSVSKLDVISSLVVSVVIFIIITIFYRNFYLSTFDKAFAKSQGINVTFYNQLLILMLTVVIIIALQAIGVILVTALLIIPPATARLITNKFANMIKFSMIIGALESVCGLFISYSFDWPSGPSIVLISAILFLIIFIFYRLRKIL
ncbi:MAG: metal ABC transporter permease [Lactobacillaceae bacterium]|jgi:iron/zinc/copper transport system permease protein|nr:metal ABC transporter permease [Lactobacillaceae bacterium]